MIIINLTQHKATPEQQTVGVVDLEGDALEELIECLTFKDLPDAEEIHARVTGIVTLAVCWQEFVHAEAAMIGGASWLIEPLTAALKAKGIKTLFAFSVRESIEQTMPDNSVRKTSVFRHKGFVQAL